MQFRSLSNTAANSVATPIGAVTAGVHAASVGSHLLSKTTADTWLYRAIKAIEEWAGNTQFGPTVKTLCEWVLAHLDQTIGLMAINLAIMLSYGHRSLDYMVGSTIVALLLPVLPLSVYLAIAIAVFGYGMAANNRTRLVVLVVAGLAIAAVWTTKVGEATSEPPGGAGASRGRRDTAAMVADMLGDTN